LPPTVQPSSWHECPDGQTTLDCPKLLGSYCLHLENSYPELRVHTMPVFQQLLWIVDNLALKNHAVGCA
jgi:hypothetical protein